MRVKNLLILQICAFVLSGGSLNASSFFRFVKWNGFVVLSGAFFWIMMITGIAMSFILRKNLLKHYAPDAKPGIICFFRNRESIVSISVCICCILLIVLNVLFRMFAGWITVLSISVGTIAFCLHCVFDGENYRIYKNFIREV